MNLELNDKERTILLESLNLAVKGAPNALQVASEILPLAVKLSNLKEEGKETDGQS